MAARENFRLQARLLVAADNIALDAILMVIEDAFGPGSVKSGPDDDGNVVAEIHCAAHEVDARRVNWLHEQLGILAKYILEATDVTCADDTGREQSYRLEPAGLDTRPAREPVAADDDSDEEAAAAPDGNDAEPATAGS
ncbi:MAG: hypothetical protein U5K43_04005 [Halofilum sp. (in: g-proteobacteria)]|nr:hypothetical protein [Halofilum sp. (in: g-proteobacteria)]